MKCPQCNGKTKVMDSIATETSVIRRRKCTICSSLFFTEELTYDDFSDLKQEFNEHKYRKQKTYLEEKA